MNELIKKKKSLIDLCFDLLELDEDFEGNKELITERLNALENKAENYCDFNSFCKSEIIRIKEEKKHLDRQIKSFERILGTLDYKAKEVMNFLDSKEISGSNGHKIKLWYSTAVNIINPDLIPTKFKTIKQETFISKSEIKAALKDGELIEGAELIKNENIKYK